MTLTSVALGPASSSEGDIDKDLPQPQHLIVPVDLCKGLGGKGYYTYLVPVNLGTTYNFISSALANGLSLDVVMASRRKKRDRVPLPITTVNGEPFCATAVIHQMVQMCDSAGVKRSNAINFVVANIAHYNIILGMAWLQKRNSDIQCNTSV